MRAVTLMLLVAGCGTSHAPIDGASDSGTIVDDAGELADAGTAIDSGLDAGTGLDAGPAVDAGPTPDAGPDDRAGWIECGATRCELAIEGCLASCRQGESYEPVCIPYDDSGAWPAEECPSGEQLPRYWLRCDGPGDCPAGERCQLIYGSLGQYAYCIPCEGECDPRMDALCHDDSDCGPDAPFCFPNGALPGYSTCMAGT